jgi:hypothetical protein
MASCQHKLPQIAEADHRDITPDMLFVGMAAADSYMVRRESGQKIMKLMLGAH